METQRDLLEKIRGFFPSPVSSAKDDAYFVMSLARGLERIDALKTSQTWLGERRPLDYAQAAQSRMAEATSSLEEIIPRIAEYLEGVPIFGHPLTQGNVGPPATIASVAGAMFAAIYNPNIMWDYTSHRVALAEIEAAAICADLVGFDPTRAGGVFTFGGTGTVLYGVKLGVEAAQPGAFQKGVRGGLRILASDASHYAKMSAAGWLGLGTDAVIEVATEADDSMRVPALETEMRRIIEGGERIACIIATVGTTDAFGLDDVDAIVALRDRLTDEYKLPYRPWVHADSVIGWAYSVFLDYDFSANPLDFPPRTLRSLQHASALVRHLRHADSIGIDFHKTGYASKTSSLFLARDRAALQTISRDLEAMPYLYQFGKYHPGVYTLETTRAGGGVLAAIANLHLLGKQGLRVLLGHNITMAECLRRELEEQPWGVVVNDANHGPVTLFRVYPDAVDAKAACRDESTRPECSADLHAHSEYNVRVFAAMQRQLERGEGVRLSRTDLHRQTRYTEPVLAMKSYITSPFVDEKVMDLLVSCLRRARQEVAQEDAGGPH